MADLENRWNVMVSVRGRYYPPGTPEEAQREEKPLHLRITPGAALPQVRHTALRWARRVLRRGGAACAAGLRAGVRLGAVAGATWVLLCRAACSALLLGAWLPRLPMAAICVAVLTVGHNVLLFFPPFPPPAAAPSPQVQPQEAQHALTSPHSPGSCPWPLLVSARRTL